MLTIHDVSCTPGRRGSDPLSVLLGFGLHGFHVGSKLVSGHAAPPPPPGEPPPPGSPRSPRGGRTPAGPVHPGQVVVDVAGDAKPKRRAFGFVSMLLAPMRRGRDFVRSRFRVA